MIPKGLGSQLPAGLFHSYAMHLEFLWEGNDHHSYGLDKQADYLNISKRQVCNRNRRLVEAGYLLVTRRWNNSDLYTPLVRVEEMNFTTQEANFSSVGNGFPPIENELQDILPDINPPADAGNDGDERGLTPDQRYLRRRLIERDAGWKELRASVVNRASARHGVGAATEVLRRLSESTPGPNDPNAMFHAILHAVTEEEVAS